MELAQELNEIHYYKYESLKDSWGKPKADNLPKNRYGCVCNYCVGSDPWLTECQDSKEIPPFDKGIYSQFCDYCLEIEQRITGDECTCESYDGQVTIPNEYL